MRYRLYSFLVALIVFTSNNSFLIPVIEVLNLGVLVLLDDFASNKTIHSTGDTNHMIQSKCCKRANYQRQPCITLLIDQQ